MRPLRLSAPRTASSARRVRARSGSLGLPSVGLAGLVLAVLTGCGSDDTERRNPTLNTNEASLQAFPTCDALDAWMTDLLTDQIAQQYLGWGDCWDCFDRGPVASPGAPEFDAGTDGSAGGGSAPPSNDGPTDFTETNTQEAGVDEPDMMKTDGRHVYTVQGNRLNIVRSWPADEMSLVATMDLPGYGGQMLRVQDRLVIFSQVYAAYNGGGWGGGRPAPDFGGDAEWDGSDDRREPEPEWIDPNALDFNGTRVLVVNVADPTAPEIEATFDIQSTYVNARAVAGRVHLVLSADPNYYDSTLAERIQALGITYENTSDQAARAAREAQLKAQIRPVVAAWVAETGREQMLPDLRIDEGTWGELYGCGDVYRPPVQAGASIMGVVTIDPATLERPVGSAVIAQGWQVYASTASLYLAQDSRWWWWGPGMEREAKTHIHRFALDTGRARYAASGAVEGWLLNQFSMSEYDGYLRLATTDHNTFGGWGGGVPVDVDVMPPTTDGGWADGGEADAGSAEPAMPEMKRIQQVGDPDVQANNLFVLREQNGGLEVVSGIRGLAPEERIYSARFIGPKAYVVTFRETDPLFTFDLSDPENPQVLGELHIPGFSTYLHPFGDDHLIGVGRDGDETGRIFGVQLQLFDVSDPTDPRRTHRVVIDQGDGWSSSEAEYDHRAFMFYAPANVLALPISLEDWSQPDGQYRHFSGMILYRVSAESGFTEIGRVSHSGLAQRAYCERLIGEDLTEDAAAEHCGWSYGWWTQMRRAMFADDWFYAISEVGITASPWRQPADVAATVTF